MRTGSLEWVGEIETPHDGWFCDPLVTWEYIGHHYIIAFNGDIIAYLDKAGHKMWDMNPALRHRIIQQIQANSNGLVNL